MRFTLTLLALAGGLFAGILLFLEFGRRIGVQRLARDPEGARAGVGVVEGAVFGLFALLIAFTFSGAASRFDDRRQLVVEEVNAVGTAWLRIELLPMSAQPPIRDGFRRYMDARLAAYRVVPDLEAARRHLAEADRAQADIWARAVAVCLTDSGERARVLLLPSLNEMFDIAEARLLVTRLHPPAAIYVMLGVTALMSALLAGYGMAGGRARNWAYMLAFAASSSAAVFVILDLEFPRLGTIRVDQFDQGLVELRARMR